MVALGLPDCPNFSSTALLLGASVALSFVFIRWRCSLEAPRDEKDDGKELGAKVPSNPPAASLFDRMGRPSLILAPMVDQSELPFRLLARRYGAQLCFTPMVNSNQFVNSAAYRSEIVGNIPPEDRPLIVQLAGHDPDTLLRAARYVEHTCDAVDLNLGCPQHIAKRGRYGSYLLEEEDLVVEIVRFLSANLSVPVTCKIRIFRDDLERSLSLCRRLEAVGCSMLTVHGRTRYQNKQTVGAADWQWIASVKSAVRIPVVANGGIGIFSDVVDCMDITGADGVMSSEAALENPALFCGNRDEHGEYVDQNRLAREYLGLARQHVPASADDECPKCVKAHLFKLLFSGLQDNHDLRDRVGTGRTFSEFESIVEELARRGWTQPMFHSEGYQRESSWYYRHRLKELQGLDENYSKVALESGSAGSAGPQGQPTDESDDVDWTQCIFDTA